ncbi:unnamed protein product [Paramecium pentaurelia]|uniref:Uncharacterized protein n=1 Tax=Paramecium pentaurelia TaxID=43138 RepID=A0A8S1W797_9CILI|nr:unnamed protein product [Paramecium pentaurelia]
MSRTGPQNQVIFDGEKKNSIRTYNDNVNNRQGFKIGWDIDQTRKEDLKIAGKVGQDQRNTNNVAYPGNIYQNEQKQDDDYMKQMYYQEMVRKQEQAGVGVQHKQSEQYYQDSLDQYGKPYGAYNYNNQDNHNHDYQQPQLLQQSNKYDHYQQPNDDEALYQKYKQGNNGNKVYSAKPPVSQYNPITGVAYGAQNNQNTYNGDTVHQGVSYQKSNPYEQQQQQDDALSQFSQLQQHKITSMKNKNSNIFNADLQETENINTRQNSRVLNRKKELDDAQYKGYGQFYNNPIEQAPSQYREQKFVNRNKIDNHIFPK